MRKMRRQIASIVGVVVVIILLAILLSKGVVHISEVSAALAYLLVGAVLALLAWGFGPEIERTIRGKAEEGTSLPVTRRKRAGRLSKLKRPPIAKEKRVDFWATVIMMAGGGIFLMYVFLTYPSTSLTPQATSAYEFTRLIELIVAIFLIVFSVWLMTAESYAIWESRVQSINQRKTAYLNALEDFDKAFEAVTVVHAPSLKVDMLYDFQPKLDVLCKNYSWYEVKDRILKVLDIIPQQLSDKSHIYVQFLAMIMKSYGENVKSIMGEKWLKEIEHLYDDPNYRTDSLPAVLYILQELHEYSADYIEKLIDNAAYQWTELKFQLLANQIGFLELKQKDELGHRRVLKYLLGKMDTATQNKDEKALGRLRMLYKNARV